MKSLLLKARAFSIMKCALLFILLLGTTLTQAQQNLLQKRITLQAGEVPLSEALHAIEKQLNCTFVYSSDINTTKKVDLNFTDMPLKQILAALLGDYASGIAVHGNQINIQPGNGKGTIAGAVQIQKVPELPMPQSA